MLFVQTVDLAVSMTQRYASILLYAAALQTLLSSGALWQAAAVTNLTAWQQGIATNYGGPADGLNANQPSFGTLDVRHTAVHLQQALQIA